MAVRTGGWSKSLILPKADGTIWGCHRTGQFERAELVGWTFELRRMTSQVIHRNGGELLGPLRCKFPRVTDVSRYLGFGIKEPYGELAGRWDAKFRVEIPGLLRESCRQYTILHAIVKVSNLNHCGYLSTQIYKNNCSRNLAIHTSGVICICRSSG